MRCSTVMCSSELWYATISPTEYRAAGCTIARSPVWNRGSMLMPWLTT